MLEFKRMKDGVTVKEILPQFLLPDTEIEDYQIGS